MIHKALSEKQLGSSSYLSGIAELNLPALTLKEIQAAVAHADEEALLDLKQRFSLAYAQTSFASFDEKGRMWSTFADATIDRALELAWKQAAKRHRLTLPVGRVPGLFLLGLGKLGGLDLNFSSDVDLIAFYDAERLPVPATKGQAYITSDVCKRVTQILQPRNASRFVWRVDWRLRPESSGTGLALSVAKAETFYFFRSLPWHRLALMKARLIAGDDNAGKKFLSRLEPFIWRRNLDFTTLDELAALKTRINNEHPGLQYERAAPEPITPEANGFNVKLGRGGIREIEFIANAQQLIHGGKRPILRVTNTRAALKALAKVGLLSRAEAESLQQDYCFLRRVENAIQMLRNEHTHIVPQGEDLNACLSLMDDYPAFDKDIFECRQRVHSKFSAIFEEATTPFDNTKVSSLSEPNAKIAQNWNTGFLEYGVSQSNSSKYRDLGARLTTRVMRQNNDEAFQRVDEFLKQIGRSEQYFSLLNRHPTLLDKLITPLLHSPHMSEILRQSPHIIDIFIASETSSLEDQSRFVLTSSDYEHRLETLRRFVNEQLFSAYTKFLEGTFSSQQMQAKLTAVAEQTLDLSIQIAREDLGLNDLSMTVLGLGKMGSQTMSPKSDLDLIFLFADDVDTELATRIVQRLRTTLTVKLREGIAYELDMRLRPSGRSGPPAVKVSAFYDHHMKRAHSWEHIALSPARIVAGDKELGAKVMQMKSEIMGRPRDLMAFKIDAYTMFERLSAERLIEMPTDIWASKLRRGGLMEADYVRSCLHVTGEQLPFDLEDASNDWNTLVAWERLLGLTAKSIEETPSRFAKTIGVTALKSHQDKLEKTVKTETERFFEGLDRDSKLEPAPIVWKN